jgi:hypothetical protein
MWVWARCRYEVGKLRLMLSLGQGDPMADGFFYGDNADRLAIYVKGF